MRPRNPMLASRIAFQHLFHLFVIIAQTQPALASCHLVEPRYLHSSLQTRLFVGDGKADAASCNASAR